MTWFGELRRRLSALFGWLRRPAQSATAQRSLPPTPVVPAAPAVVRATVPAESSIAAAAVPAPSASQSAAVSVTAGSVAGASVAAASVAAASVAAASVAASSVAAASVVAPVVAKRAAPAEPERPTLDTNLGQLKARQFFARMIAATPAGLTIDFTDWQSASVERFFMAMTSPGLTRRREAPTSGVEQVSLTNAFQGFEWD